METISANSSFLSELSADESAPACAAMNLAAALNDALRLKMSQDQRIYLIGEDVGAMGGVFRVTSGLQAEFGEVRIIDSPLSETALVGAAVGMAMGGLRPIVEIQFMDFIYPAVDQIINELAKLRYRSGGQFSAPVVIRAPYGGGIGGGLYHSQSSEAVFLNVPGLKVVTPSNPADAKGLLIAALEDNDPVLFLEPKRLYKLFTEQVPISAFRVPLGKGAIVRRGRDLTLIAYGGMVRVALEAAELAATAQVDCEVIDLRTLNPWDEEIVLESVARTQSAVVLHEAPLNCGFGAEISARITEELFRDLRTPVRRVGGYDTHYPYGLETSYYPTAVRVFNQIRELQ
jgi:2-oxoisovalerate dehydrogenase E1 component beta subunit